jgi:F420-non-reducing hydrogenase iron-sulfur subunit
MLARTPQCSNTVSRPWKLPLEGFLVSTMADTGSAVSGASFEPRVIAFLCNWCSYSAADLAGQSRLPCPANVRVVRVPCSGRVDPELILRAFARGADGVLVCGCHPGDCHYLAGNYKAAGRIALLRRMLGLLGVNPERLVLSWASASEGQRFVSVAAETTAKLRALGPRSAGGEAHEVAR